MCRSPTLISALSVCVLLLWSGWLPRCSIRLRPVFCGDLFLVRIPPCAIDLPPAMRTSLLLFACLAASAAVCLVSAETAPNTPPNDSGTGEPMCLLSGLSFTNGLTLTPAFTPGHFTYQCSCDFSASSFTTVVTPTLMDSGSSAEIRFNGVKINDRDFNNAISNLGTRLDSPRQQSDPLTFVTGSNTIVVGVACNGYGEPIPCYYEYTITCTKPPPSGGQVVGDPQFVGLRGQSYQVHGVAGEIYNIVSDADLQYNSRFVFLNSGECPVVNGRKQKSCWSHPGSYLGELGLKTANGERVHLVTGSAKRGFESVAVNGKELRVGDSVVLKDGAGFVSRNSTHLASVQIGNWDFAFENSDKFVNQRVRVIDARKLRAHGLLGQTWREATYPNAIKFVQGQVDDYVIRDQDIFGDNFLFNAFN